MRVKETTNLPMATVLVLDLSMDFSRQEWDSSVLFVLQLGNIGFRNIGLSKQEELIGLRLLAVTC